MPFAQPNKPEPMSESTQKDAVRYRALVANLPGAAIFEVDHDLRYRLADGQALREAGMTPADLEGKTIGKPWMPTGQKFMNLSIGRPWPVILFR